MQCARWISNASNDLHGTRHRYAVAWTILSEKGSSPDRARRSQEEPILPGGDSKDYRSASPANALSCLRADDSLRLEAAHYFAWTLAVDPAESRTSVKRVETARDSPHDLPGRGARGSPTLHASASCRTAPIWWALNRKRGLHHEQVPCQPDRDLRS